MNTISSLSFAPRRRIFVSLLLPFMFLLFSFFVLADELDKRWVYPGDTFERDGTIFSVDSAGTQEKLLLTAGEYPFILSTGTCKENIQAHEKYCITQAAYEDDDEDHIRYEHGEQIFGYYLVTESVVPELKVTRSINPSTPSYNKQSTVTVKLTNEGEKAIQSIKYAEYIPKSLLLSVIDGSFSSINSVYSFEKSSLAPGSSVTFQYTLTPQEYIASTVKPNITYAYDFIKKEASLSALTLSLTQPITIEKSLSASTLSLNEQAAYTLSVTNDAESKLSLTLSVDLPEGMRIDNLGSFKYSGDDLTLSRELKSDETYEASFTFSTQKTGTYPFSVTVDGRVDNERITRYYQESIKTEIQPLEVRFLLSKADAKLLSGEPLTLRVYAKNTYDHSFSNIKGDVSGDVVSGSVFAEKIVTNEEKLLKEFRFTAPDVTAQTNKDIMLQGSYKSTSDELFTFEKKLTVTITPKTDAFLITQKLNVSEPKAGDIVKMTTSVKNSAQPYSFVTIKDTLPFDVFSGKSDAEISLDANQERQVYVYEFKIPEDFSENNFTITTSIRTGDLANEKSLVVVLKETTNELPSDSQSDSLEITHESEVEQKQEGMFTRAWNWLKGFFSSDE